VALGSASSAISIVGATGGTIISFIIPGMMGIAIAPSFWRKLPSILVIVFGCVVACTAVSANIYMMVEAGQNVTKVN
jgi:amino acid permease